LKQIVENQSNIWLPLEINSAASYAHALHNHVIMIMLTIEEEKYRSQSEVLKETNDELENINWISAHDLQEPLRKIQLIISKLLSEEIDAIPPESIADALERVSNSANRMQALLQDILKYTRVKYAKDAIQQVDLNEIMKATLDEMSESIHESNAVIEFENLPEVYGVNFLLKQLFSNLLQNSLKYASTDRLPVIKVTASQKPEKYLHSNKIYCHWVTFTDNGIGFEQEYAKSIFKIFTRLHTKEKYSGSGVGLALCKKIMQTCGGNITAEGKPDEGTAITIYFPCDHLNPLL
jgi:chemotaxis family two-component system sensor kinase Cph1